MVERFIVNGSIQKHDQGGLVYHDDYARLQEQLEAVTRELEMWQAVKHSSYWKARAARLEAALRLVKFMRTVDDLAPAVHDFEKVKRSETWAKIEAEIDAALDVKEK